MHNICKKLCNIHTPPKKKKKRRRRQVSSTTFCYWFILRCVNRHLASIDIISKLPVINVVCFIHENFLILIQTLLRFAFAGWMKFENYSLPYLKALIKDYQ